MCGFQIIAVSCSCFCIDDPFTNFGSRSEGLYNTIDELRLQHPGLPGRGSGGPIPYNTFRSSMNSGSSEFSNPHELSGKVWSKLQIQDTR